MTTRALAFLAGLLIGVALGLAAWLVVQAVKRRRYRQRVAMLDAAIKASATAATEMLRKRFAGPDDVRTDCPCEFHVAQRAAAAKRN